MIVMNTNDTVPVVVYVCVSTANQQSALLVHTVVIQIQNYLGID